MDIFDVELREVAVSVEGEYEAAEESTRDVQGSPARFHVHNVYCGGAEITNIVISTDIDALEETILEEHYS